jgi:hypothetical protein
VNVLRKVVLGVLPGFAFRESLAGSFHLLDAPADERAIALELEMRASALAAFVRERAWYVEGDLRAEGLAEHAPVKGTLGFRLFDEKRLPYRLGFDADDGKRYELRGQKDWTPIAPLESMTVLSASLYDEQSREVGRATLRWDLRNDLARTLASFRLEYAR